MTPCVHEMASSPSLSVVKIVLINLTIPSCSSRHFLGNFYLIPPLLFCQCGPMNLNRNLLKPVNNQYDADLFLLPLMMMPLILCSFRRMVVTTASSFIPRDHSRNEIHLGSVLYRNSGFQYFTYSFSKC